MKITLHEFDDHFSIDLEPETLVDAATVARLATNWKQSLHVGAYASSTNISAYVNIGKDPTPPANKRFERQARFFGDERKILTKERDAALARAEAAEKENAKFELVSLYAVSPTDQIYYKKGE